MEYHLVIAWFECEIKLHLKSIIESFVSRLSCYALGEFPSSDEGFTIARSTNALHACAWTSSSYLYFYFCVVWVTIITFFMRISNFMRQ